MSSNAILTHLRLRAVREVTHVYRTGSASEQTALASPIMAEVHAQTQPGGLHCVRNSVSQVKLSYLPLPCMHMVD